MDSTIRKFQKRKRILSLNDTNVGNYTFNIYSTKLFEESLECLNESEKTNFNRKNTFMVFGVNVRMIFKSCENIARKTLE